MNNKKKEGGLSIAGTTIEKPQQAFATPDANKSPKVAGANESRPAQPQEDDDQLWQRVAECETRGRVAWFMAGYILSVLQNRYRYSQTTFGSKLTEFAGEWGLSSSTLYERMRFYRDMRRRIDEVHLTKISAEELRKFGLTRADWDEASDFDVAAERALADKELAQMNGFLALASAQVQQARQAAGQTAPSLTLKVVGLTEEQRLAARKLERQIGQGLAAESGADANDPKAASRAYGRWLFEVMLAEAARHPPVAATTPQPKHCQRVALKTKGKKAA